MSPTSGRVDCEAAQPSRCCRWHTLGVNSGANSAPINQLIRAPRRRPKSCYINTPRVRSRSNFEQGSAKYEKKKDISRFAIVIYTATAQRNSGAKMVQSQHNCQPDSADHPQW